MIQVPKAHRACVAYVTSRSGAAHRAWEPSPDQRRVSSNAKAPVPRADGDRALYLISTPRTDCWGKWHPKKHSCFLPLQRSHFEPLADGLTGPTGISPVQSSAIRSQDEPPWKLSISASFRILPDPSKTSYVRGIALRRDKRPIPSRAIRRYHRQLRAEPHLSELHRRYLPRPVVSMPVVVRSRCVRKPLVLDGLATVAGSAACLLYTSDAADDL